MEIEGRVFSKVYFLGIGGIGMSALARWFNANGYPVAGYDKTPSPLTDSLKAEGIKIHFQDAVEAIPEEFLNKEETLVVLTPAIPKNHSGWNYLQEKKYTILKRSAILGAICRSHAYVLAVAGTHGKTTTSTMLAHLLQQAGKPVSAFLGGISANYNSNLILSKALPNESIAVVEADEFDRSFLQLHPNLSIITSTDADHLDIYGQAETLKETFSLFANQTKELVALAPKVEISLEAQQTSAATLNYGTNQEAASQLTNLVWQEGKMHFGMKIQSPKGVVEVSDLELAMPGEHNALNALAAATLCCHIKEEKWRLTSAEIKQGFASFAGVQRRFQYIVNQPPVIFIDDYAHHPTEISAFLKAVRDLYPNKHITVIFQPHLFSRTRDFMEGFAESLSHCDRLILMDIYPARELPIPGVSSDVLLQKVPMSEKLLLPPIRIMGYLSNQKTDVLCTVGAGDIDRLVQPLKDWIVRQYHK